MSGFDLLHPAVQHHVVNSLGWRSLRPLQEAAVAPLLAGEHVLLVAPTAGGKTEAAVLPLLSRMTSEGWRGLSVIYVCPTKALLNNLTPRLDGYAQLLGRRAAVWHGDVGASARRALLADPPDLLLTTPESLEAMLISRHVEHGTLFPSLRAVVIDELHAFAGDDRGWHLLAVLERVGRIAGRELQRVGLSATIGNPAEMLDWLAGHCDGDRRVIAPDAGPPGAVNVVLDHVGSLSNAARVVAGLHRGEKRLVFCDSRSKVEELATHLRELDVETFVSHSSLSLDERRRAEEAFGQGSNCVIVATSTLELGVDVGDLDRVIQIDAPFTVASFLQRLGRTGRRAGTERNCLFLTLTDEAFIRAAGLLILWGQGYVEPVVPPPNPFHILAQQLLALTLQEGQIGRRAWQEWLDRLPPFADAPAADEIVDFMVCRGLLFDDNDLLSMGPGGEASYGWRHFSELTSVFTGDPAMQVRHGAEDLGSVHPATLSARRSGFRVLLLGGRRWAVRSVDWTRRRVYVEPASSGGRSRWLGDSRALGFALCRAMRDVLCERETPPGLTARGTERVDTIRRDFGWLEPEGTTIQHDSDGSIRWWTFAGAATNRVLAEALGDDAHAGATDNLTVQLAGAETPAGVLELIRRWSGDPGTSPADALDDDLVKGLKFSAALPADIARAVVGARALDPVTANLIVAEPIHTIRSGGEPVR